MKVVFFLILALATSLAGAQPGVLRYDRVIIQPPQGKTAAELVIQNATKARAGAFLKNIGAGVTEFDYALDNVSLSGNVLTFTKGETTIPLTLPTGTSYTDAQARSAVGSILSPEFTYDYNIPSISINSIAWAKVTGRPTTLSGYGITLVASDIPNLDASKITSGVFPAARLGTGTASATSVLQGDGVFRSSPTLSSLSLTGGSLALHNSSVDLSAPTSPGHIFFQTTLGRARIYQSGAWSTLLTDADAVQNQVSTWQTGGLRVSDVVYGRAGGRFGPESSGSDVSLTATLHVQGTARITGATTIEGATQITGAVTNDSWTWTKGLAIFGASSATQKPRLQTATVSVPVNAISGTTMSVNRFSMSFDPGTPGSVGPHVLFEEQFAASTSTSNFQAGVAPLIQPGASIPANFMYTTFRNTPTVNITAPYTYPFVGYFYHPTLTSTNGAKNYAFYATSGGVRLAGLASGVTSEAMDGTTKRLIIDQDGDIGTADNIPVANQTAPTSSADATGVNGEIRVSGGFIYWKAGGSWYRLAGSTF